MLTSKPDLRSNPAPVSLLDVNQAAIPPRISRIVALDFTKGLLVLLMVLYHWINYFVGPQWEYYYYLRFLTPSFVFISGFMVSRIYLSKYSVADNRISKRLVTRAIKIMGIFVSLNGARFVVIPLLGTGVIPNNLLDSGTLSGIFLTGDLPVSSVKLVSFSILVPLSYLLALSGILMLPYRYFRHTFHFVCALLLISILIMKFLGTQNSILEVVTIGMLGLLVGYIPIKRIDSLANHLYAIGFAYLCYLIAITVWNVPFLLLISGVLLNLTIIYLIGSSGSDHSAIKSHIALLGKYSLFGYLSQIAILQILSAIFYRSDLGIAVLGVTFFAAFILTILSVEAVDRGRTRVATVDRFYKAIFA
jgi:peptidoglycan/LPS O-acetylase OafA/YrhL